MYSRSYFHTKWLVVIAVVLTSLLSSAGGANATDCNTNCDDACTVTVNTGLFGKYEYMDHLCRQRCLVEKKVSCVTGGTACDLWRGVPDFYQTIDAIETANQNGVVDSESACHQIVDGGSLAYSGLSKAYEYATKAAKSTKATIIGWAIQEAVVHHMHCACSSAAYKPVPKHDAVYLQNQCSRKISTAIHYKALDGQWITQGWWILAPGEKAFVAKTNNTIFYTYAESTDPVSRLYWSGSDYYDVIRGSTQRYGFKKQQITSKEWGTWTTNFTCK